jgi:hypothetical protein
MSDGTTFGYGDNTCIEYKYIYLSEYHYVCLYVLRSHRA